MPNDHLIPLSDAVSASVSDWELWPCNTTWVGVESSELRWGDHRAKESRATRIPVWPTNPFHDASYSPKSRQPSQGHKLSSVPERGCVSKR